MHSDFDLERAEGAGGKGPIGGGGGSSNGGGEPKERLRFVQMVPAPSDAAKVPLVPVPPAPVTPPVNSPLLPQPAVPSPAASQPAAQAPNEGAGAGGSGSGGGAGGAGPGRGGGVGSGEGTGRGSATGPGTGGGNAKNFPPTPKQFFLPPLPAPKKVRGFHLIAWFDVDSLGKSTLLRFTPTPDGEYNKRLRETLLALKFRPATRPDGTPIRDTVNVEFTF